MPTLDSQELLRRFKKGDSQAAATIFDRYVRRLIALARSRIGPKLGRRIDAEDVVQSAYRSFFAHAENEEYVLTRSGDLWRLLASITLNKLYGQAEKHTAARRNIEREDGASSLANAAAAPEPSPVEIVAIVEQLHLVSERLTSVERTVLTARLQGQTVEAIGELIQKSPRTVRRILANTQRQIEQQLAASEDTLHRSTENQVRQVFEPRAPLIYSDYVLERLLGAGGMGKVYRATQRITGKQVAIKALLKARQRDRNAVEKFLQEAQILAKLNHPNIVAVQGVGRFPGGGYFIAMDFVDGTDLQSLLANGPLGIKQAVRLLRDVGSAVAHAHARGIVHGDLKPANVLLDKTNRAVVTDFGLAQFIVKDGEPHVPNWLIGGTAGYIAPEVRTLSTTPTPAADIYGLGALLWALATGIAPDGLVSLPGNDLATRWLCPICEQCLAVDPAERFRSANKLVEELNRFDTEQ